MFNFEKKTSGCAPVSSSYDGSYSVQANIQSSSGRLNECFKNKATQIQHGGVKNTRKCIFKNAAH